MLTEGNMLTTLKALICKSLYGIVLLAIIFSIFVAGNTSSAHAQEGGGGGAGGEPYISQNRITIVPGYGIVTVSLTENNQILHIYLLRIKIDAFSATGSA
jgi:hypothetical protein